MCDYVFFCASSTTDPFLGKLCRKTLFDLLKNYSYRSWLLGLPHLLTALDNLGMDMRAVTDEDYMNEVVSSRLDAVDGRQDAVVPKMHPFHMDRLKKQKEKGEVPAVSEENASSHIQSSQSEAARINCIKVPNLCNRSRLNNTLYVFLPLLGFYGVLQRLVGEPPGPYPISAVVR